MTNIDHYFSQTRQGESRWWSWLISLWLAVIVWAVGSTFLLGPVPGLAEAKNPELLQPYFDAQADIFQRMSVRENALMMTLMMLAVALGLIFWAINRFSKGMIRTITGWLCGLSVAASVYALIKVWPVINSPEGNAAFMPMIGESAIAYALMLLTFPAFLVGLYLCQKFIHKRTITSLHTAATKVNWRRILFAIGLTWGVLGLMSALLHITGISPLRTTFDPSRFFTFALATLIFIPMQSGTEEIVFRGYLNQGLERFISNKWIVYILTSIMFAAMHLSNPESLAGAEAGSLTHLLVMSQYFLFGFFLCIVVHYEGGLEGAIGVHAGNNMFAAMFVNYEGSVLPTPSAFLATPNSSIDPITTMIFLAVITYILCKSAKPIVPAG